MDPVTQGVLGAVTAQAVLPARHGHVVWIGGLAGGLLPDADVLLRPWSDPALPWELHRHFSHSIVLAPVLGLVAAALLWLAVPPLRRAPGGLRRAPTTLCAAAIVGALTHAPLDLCTSYGTKILWPFSLRDWTLDLYPIVDPLFTLVLLVAIVVAARRRTRAPALVAMLFLALYTGAALHQRSAAREAQAQLAASRGHSPVRARVMPLPGSLLAWRSLYEVDGRAVADLLRTTWGGARMIAGGSLPLLRPGEAEAGAKDPERVRDVVRRFATFADGWVARDPADPASLGDVRFSADAGLRPLWAIRLATAPDDPPVRWTSPSLASRDLGALWAVLRGTSRDLVPVPGRNDR